MGRYNLNDEKRKQIAQMINSESKRLARMVQTFLDVERLHELDERDLPLPAERRVTGDGSRLLVDAVFVDDRGRLRQQLVGHAPRFAQPSQE